MDQQNEPILELSELQEDRSENSSVITPFYAEHAITRIPAFDIGYSNSRQGVALRFSWAGIDSRGRPYQSQCEVQPVRVRDSINSYLPGDFEAQLMDYLVHEYVNKRPPDGYIVFDYDDLGEAWGLSKATLKSSVFRAKVKNGIRVLKSAVISTVNAWSEDSGQSFKTETAVDYIDDFEISSFEDRKQFGRGEKDTFRVALGKRFRQNLDNKHFSALPLERFKALKGRPHQRRLASVIFTRAGEIGNPVSLNLYEEDLKIALAMKSKSGGRDRSRELLRRYFADLKTHGLLIDLPDERRDQHGRYVFVSRPRYPQFNSENPNALDSVIDEFGEALKTFRQITLASRGVTKEQLRALLERHREKKIFGGYEVFEALAVLESLLVQYGSQGQVRKGFIALTKGILASEEKEFNFCESPFVPVQAKARRAREEEMLERESLERRKLEDELDRKTRDLYLKHQDHFRNYYRVKFLETYSKDSGYARRRLEQFKKDVSTIDREANEWLKEDIKDGKREMLP